MLLQAVYVNTILTRFHMQDTKHTQTPMNPESVLSMDQCLSTHTECEDMKDIPYQKAIGFLMYVAVSTCPNITFVISTLL